MKNKTYLLLLSILIFGSSAIAQGNLGQAGANFLQIVVEPRGAAMGKSVTASASGAAALYWNPAGAISPAGTNIMLAQTNWFLDTKLTYGAAVFNPSGRQSFGFFATAMTMDKMEVTSEVENNTGQEYSAGDLALGISYARNLTDRFTYGLSVKYVQEHIWNETASQMAIDLGSVYRTDFLNLRIGMVIRNIAGKMEFSGSDIDDRIAEELDRGLEDNPRAERLTPGFRLPQDFQLGIAFEPLSLPLGRLLVCGDVNVPSDNRQQTAFGLEYQLNQMISVRGGYQLQDDTAGLTLGGGLVIPISQLKTGFDFSYSAHRYLGYITRFSLNLFM